MDSGILMIQDSILVCSPDPRIPHTAVVARKVTTQINVQRRINAQKMSGQ
jgi:hypothetical protein